MHMYTPGMSGKITYLVNLTKCQGRNGVQNFFYNDIIYNEFNINIPRM